LDNPPRTCSQRTCPSRGVTSARPAALDDLALCLNPRLLAAKGQGVPHALDEGRGVDGFLQEVESAGLHGPDAGAQAAHARDEDDRDRLLPGAEVRPDFKAAAPVP
jgi:hypothetical protein